MVQKRDIPVTSKILSVLIGAFIIGFIWRARGTHGFGAFWGLVSVGLIFTLLIFTFYGKRPSIKSELIPIGAVMMGITVPAWGAVVSMTGGSAYSIAAFSGETDERVINFSQSHGIILMLMLGFSLMCLYSIFVGTLFSKRKYKIVHYMIFVSLFFAGAYIAEATFSHSLIKFICPDVVSAFRSGVNDLSEANKSLTLREIYVQHFNNMSWAKKVPFGRFYFESIEHISYAFGALVTVLSALIIFRDKITAVISFIINLITSLSITVADFFNINNSGIFNDIHLPAFLKLESWELWEYFTGFFIGLGIMLVLALLPSSLTSESESRSESFIENKYIRMIFNYLIFVFVFIVVPVRAFCLRVARNAYERSFIANEDTAGIILTAVISLSAAIPFLFVFKKNLIDKDLPVSFKIKPYRFAAITLPVYFSYFSIIYLFTGDAHLVRIVYRAIKIPSGLKECLTGEFISLPIVLFSIILVAFLMIPVKRLYSEAH